MQYYKYRQPLIIVEGLVIRSIHDKIWNHPDAIPIEHSDETCQAGLALYKYFLSSYAHPDLEELMIRKHDLFIAILRAGEKSEKKVACPLGQALLACSLMGNGQWRKASLVRSLVTTAQWSLSAIDAHWCRLATTGDERYVPFSSAESHLITPDISEIQPPNDPAPADTNNLLYNETDEESGEEDGIETSGDELSHNLDFGVIDMVELEETLQRISRVLDTPDSPNSESKKARPFNSVAIKQ
jgi:hypothetical protein